MSVGIIAASVLICTTTVWSEETGDAEIRKTIEEYCTSVSDLAAERRAARQASALKELQAKVENRLNELEQHTNDLAELIQKREALRALADKELVDIYSGVEAEAAAAQMERLDLPLASSVLRQLKPRQASAILNVMKPELAAQLVRLIAANAADGRVTQ
jgi:flagellar motility protein MotE (MotC chaperone)